MAGKYHFPITTTQAVSILESSQAVCKRLLFPLLHVEKGHPHNATANCVPVSPCFQVYILHKLYINVSGKLILIRPNEITNRERLMFPHCSFQAFGSSSFLKALELQSLEHSTRIFVIVAFQHTAYGCRAMQSVQRVLETGCPFKC